VVDEVTHECLAIRVARKLKATDVINVPPDLLILRGVPGHVRSDNVLCREGSAAWGVRSQGIRATGCHEMVAQAGSAVKKWSLP
jgi:hypothetical protein